jgi:hypothetical protein
MAALVLLLLLVDHPSLMLVEAVAARILQQALVDLAVVLMVALMVVLLQMQLLTQEEVVEVQPEDRVVHITAATAAPVS